MRRRYDSSNHRSFPASAREAPPRFAACRRLRGLSIVGALAASVCAMGGGLVGCDPHREATADARPMRLVSFAPALTKMIVDLGAADRLVAVADHDAAAPAGLPSVGNFLDVHLERLIGLEPTHVLLQSSRRGAPGELTRWAERGAFEIVRFSYPRSIDEVLDLLAAKSPERGRAERARNVKERGSDSGRPERANPSPPTEAGGGATPNDSSREPLTLGRLLGRPERARRLRRTVEAKLRRISAAAAPARADGKATGSSPRRVLLLLSTDPAMAVGPGQVHDDLLHRLHAVNASAAANVGAPTYDREGLLRTRADVIVLLTPGAPRLSGWDDPRLAGFRGLPLPAVEHRRIALLNQPLVLVPSTNLPQVAAGLAKAIYPSRAARIDAALAGDAD